MAIVFSVVTANLLSNNVLILIKVTVTKETIIAVLLMDQYQYLGNCPPTPPLTHQQSIDNKLGLVLG